MSLVSVLRPRDAASSTTQTSLSWLPADVRAAGRTGVDATFARGTAMPTEFTYRSAIPDFTIWGYDVHVRRAGDAFLQLSAARTDGPSFTVAGSGSGAATIATPPRFSPGSAHAVTIAHAGQRTEKTMIAGPDGSMVVTADSDGSPTTVTISYRRQIYRLPRRP